MSTSNTPMAERRLVATGAANAPTYRHCLPGFGWRLVASESSPAVLTFSRDTEISYRDDLVALQHGFEAGLARISRLEWRTRQRARLTSMTILLLGLAVLVGSVLALFSGLLTLSVVSALLGAALCVVPALTHTRVTELFEARSAERIDQEYGRVSAIYSAAKDLSGAATAVPDAR